MMRGFGPELSGMLRDRQVAMILVLSLVLYGLIYPAPYRPELLREVPVVAVDQDGGALARDLLRQIDASEAVALTPAPDMAEAILRVQRRDAAGILLIPEGFDRGLLSGRQAPVTVYADASYFLFYQKVLTGVAIPARQLGVQVAAQRLGAQGVSGRAEALALANPARLVEIPLFNPSGGYATYVLPAALVLILHQTMAMGLALVAVRNPGGGLAALPGRALAWLSLYAVLLPLMLVAVPRAYGLPWLGNLPLLAALGLPFVLATGLMAQLLAALLKRTELIQPVMLALGLPLFMLTGFSWPTEAIPLPLQHLAQMIPATPMIDGYTRLAAMGAGAAELAAPLRILWAQVAGFLTALVLLRVWRGRSGANAAQIS